MKVSNTAGDFAGDKDVAAHIRDSYIRPMLSQGKIAILDFDGVSLATQSFIHALLALVVREDPESLQNIRFVKCNDSIQSLIEIVVEYAQDEFD